MIRSLLSGALLCAAGCANAPEPKTPEELIVGTWDCRLASMRPGGHHLLTFGRNGSLRLDFESALGDERYSAFTNLQMYATGSYVVEGMTISVALDDVDIKSMAVDGEAIQTEDLTMLEEVMLDSMGSSLATTTLDVLDAQNLTMAAIDNSPPTTCKRHAV